jgi:hypothetical protein
MMVYLQFGTLLPGQREVAGGSALNLAKLSHRRAGYPGGERPGKVPILAGLPTRPCLLFRPIAP